MSGKTTENPYAYGTPEFGHWRTQQTLQEQARQAGETARQVARQAEQNDTLFKQRMADLSAEQAAIEQRRKAAADAQLEPERVRRRRQFLIEHADLNDAGWRFDTKVWPLLRDDLLDQQQLEQAATYFLQAGYSDEQATAREREIVNERQRKAGR